MESTTSAAAAAVTAAGKAASYCLRWNTFGSHLTEGLGTLLDENEFTDVTLACNGQFLKAHKLLLSLCSPFLKRLFKENEIQKTGTTIVILNNVRFEDLKCIVHFIYHGEVNVQQADLDRFLKTAEMLQIDGLAQPIRRERPLLKDSEEIQQLDSAGSYSQPITLIDNDDEVLQSSDKQISSHYASLPKRPRFTTSPMSRLESILTSRSYGTEENHLLSDTNNTNGCMRDDSILPPSPEIKEEYGDRDMGIRIRSETELLDTSRHDEDPNLFQHIEEDHEEFHEYEDTLVNSSEECLDDFSTNETTGIRSETSQPPKDSSHLRHSDRNRVPMLFPISRFAVDNRLVPKPPFQPCTSTLPQFSLEMQRRQQNVTSILGLEHNHFNRRRSRHLVNCDYEPESSALVSILQQPTIIADEDGRAQCPECLKFYKNRSSLKVHKSVYHRKGVSSNGTPI